MSPRTKAGPAEDEVNVFVILFSGVAIGILIAIGFAALLKEDDE